MAVSRARIAQIIANQIETGDTKQLSTEIAAYLLDAGRSGELDSLMRDVSQLRADKGVMEVIARSAYPLSEAVRAEITATLKLQFPDAKQIIISELHDSDVVAGVRLDMANQQLDLSIRSKLKRFKQLTTLRS